jgi:hypothetical protein
MSSGRACTWVAVVPDASILGDEVWLGIDADEHADGGHRTVIVGMNAAFEAALLERREGMDWIGGWLAEPAQRRVTLHMAVDRTRLGGLLAPLLTARGVVTEYGKDEMADAASALQATLKERTIRVVHPDAALDRAVKAGRRRFLPGALRWFWGGDDIAGLIALTLAYFQVRSRPADAWAMWDGPAFGGSGAPNVQRHGGALWPTYSDHD